MAVEAGDRISFGVRYYSGLYEASTYFTPTVSYIDASAPQNPTDISLLANITASSTAAGYEIAGLTDLNISSVNKKHEWQAASSGEAWLNYAFAAPTVVTGFEFLTGESGAVGSDVTCTFSDGSTYTIASDVLPQTAGGFVRILLPQAKTTDFVKLSFADSSSAPVIGDLHILG